jgi:molecular chaperone HscB
MDLFNRSHYEWFSLPERFEVDLDALEAAYRRVQGSVHPDRFAKGTDVERRLALQLATRANEAYRTLRDPVQRARYLCERAGVSLEAESNTTMPPAFLMQQMQWREALDDARTDGDVKAFEALRQTLERERKALVSALAEALDGRGDAHAGAALARRLMFLDKFGSDIDAAAEMIVR